MTEFLRKASFSTVKIRPLSEDICAKSDRRSEQRAGSEARKGIAKELELLCGKNARAQHVFKITTRKKGKKGSGGENPKIPSRRPSTERRLSFDTMQVQKYRVERGEGDRRRKRFYQKERSFFSRVEAWPLQKGKGRILEDFAGGKEGTCRLDVKREDGSLSSKKKKKSDPEGAMYLKEGLGLGLEGGVPGESVLSTRWIYWGNPWSPQKRHHEDKEKGRGHALGVIKKDFYGGNFWGRSPR